MARFYSLRNWKPFFFFENESHLCYSERVHQKKDVCICCVLPKACVLGFYLLRETAIFIDKMLDVINFSIINCGFELVPHVSP